MNANDNLTAKQRAVLAAFADGGKRTEYAVWRDVHWPDGWGKPGSFHGHLRKLTERGLLVTAGRPTNYTWQITDEGRKALAA